MEWTGLDLEASLRARAPSATFTADFAPIATHYRLGSDASWALTEVMQLLPARFAVLMDDGSAAEAGAAIDAVARHLGGFRMQEDTGRYRLSVGRHKADLRLAKFTANDSSAGMTNRPTAAAQRPDVPTRPFCVPFLCGMNPPTPPPRLPTPAPGLRDLPVVVRGVERPRGGRCGISRSRFPPASRARWRMRTLHKFAWILVHDDDVLDLCA